MKSINTAVIAISIIMHLLYSANANTNHKDKTAMQINKPGVVLTFDDHSITHWVHTIPLFEKYGAHVTFFIDQWDKLSPEQITGLKQLRAAGNAIGCHSLRHYPAIQYCKNHTLEQYMDAEIYPAVQLMQDAGFNPVCFAYPCSQHNKATDEALLKIFRHLRSGTGHGDKTLDQLDTIFTKLDKISGKGCLIGTCVQPHSTDDPLLAEVDKAFARAKQNNEIVVFYAHDIRKKDTPGPSNYITPNALEKVLKAAKDNGLNFYTFAELP